MKGKDISSSLQNLFEVFLVFSYKSDQNFTMPVAEQVGITKFVDCHSGQLNPYFQHSVVRKGNVCDYIVYLSDGECLRACYLDVRKSKQEL